MATTVKELIDYLKGIPLDTELRVFEVSSVQGYEVIANLVPLELDNVGNVKYTNLARNPLIPDNDPLFDKRFLDFGSDL